MNQHLPSSFFSRCLTDQRSSTATRDNKQSFGSGKQVNGHKESTKTYSTMVETRLEQEAADSNQNSPPGDNSMQDGATNNAANATTPTATASAVNASTTRAKILAQLQGITNTDIQALAVKDGGNPGEEEQRFPLCLQPQEHQKPWECLT